MELETKAAPIEVRPPSPADAQEYIVRVINGWKSQYRYVLAFRSVEKRVFIFASSWSPAPTSKAPLPDVRVGVEFRVSYPKLKHIHRAATSAGVAQAEAGVPEITFRIEHEQFVHRVPPLISNADAAAGTVAVVAGAAVRVGGDSKTPAPAAPAPSAGSIDHHITRLIQFKTEFNKTHPVYLENSDYFESRQRYEAIPEPAKEADAEGGAAATRTPTADGPDLAKLAAETAAATAASIAQAKAVADAEASQDAGFDGS